MTTPTRQFLGWDAPALPEAVKRLLQRCPDADFSDVLIAVPTARAGRRLLELLVEAAAGRAFAPPTITTLGLLPETLYTPDRPLASPLHARLARIHALREADDAQRAKLLNHPPEIDDLPQWWRIAEQLDALAADLAAHRLSPSLLLQRAEERAVDLRGAERYETLATLEAAYHATLASLGYQDTQAARFEAARDQRCCCDQHIILLGTADLSPQLAAMLAQLTSPVEAWVFAPESHAAGFDELGVLKPAYWAEQHIPIPNASLRFVDSPTDQAVAAAEAIQQFASPSPDAVTLVLGDETLGPTVKRCLGYAGAPARLPHLQAVSQSPPAVLLDALARFHASRRSEDLAELIRHPDLERFLGEPDAAWLTRMDRYAADTLHGRLSGFWLGDAKEIAPLKRMWEKLVSLLPAKPHEQRTLPEWSPAIAAALSAVYEDRPLDRARRTDRPLIDALERLGEVLRENATLPRDGAVTPTVSFAQAVRLTLMRLSQETLPDRTPGPAVEMVGLLELALDDAPIALVTMANEGRLPMARNADPFLPNTLRTQLGLSDNTHRYARDAWILQTAAHSKPHAIFIAGRQSPAGDPLAVSRLLLACDATTQARRVEAFFGGQPAPNDAVQAPAVHTTPRLLQPGEVSQFLIPPPMPLETPFDTLRVTGFRDYIACPYRFYLKHVLKLSSLNDQAVELDALQFGNTAHDVFEAFGKSELSACDKADKIRPFLSNELDKIVEKRFGRELRVAMTLQVEQLRRRMDAFANEQARLAQDGWRIQHVEKDVKATIEVDGQPFTVTGKLDRVDLHDVYGYRILDYKTGDKGSAPRATHLKSGEWVDLQLPLYLDLAKALDIRGDVELGYLNLPKKPEDTRFAPLEWESEERAMAFAQRDAVVRGVLAQQFWPPNEPPRFADDFTGLCADAAMDRATLIEASRTEGGAA